MPDGIALLSTWGYLGIFLAVALGNIGVPLPEETILALAGYAAQRGQLKLPAVLVVGVIRAVVGDNIGYWLGDGTDARPSSATVAGSSSRPSASGRSPTS